MEAAYTQITELPYDLPEVWRFLDKTDLPDHKRAELIELLEKVNYNAAIKAVAYCTEKVRCAQVAEAAELHYETILELQKLRERHSRHDTYTTMYDKLRKLVGAGYKAWIRLILRSLRQTVATQVRIMSALDARVR
jgi:hypothetical protein